MSAPQSFQIRFVYPDEAAAQASLKAAKRVKDTVLGTLKRDGIIIRFEEENVYPSGMYEPTLVAISYLAEGAFAGKAVAWHDGEDTRIWKTPALPGIPSRASFATYVVTDFLCGEPRDTKRLSTTDRTYVRACFKALKGPLRDRLAPLIAEIDAHDAKQAARKTGGKPVAKKPALKTKSVSKKAKRK